MPKISIDPSRCAGAGFCALTCPQAIFRQRTAGEVPRLARAEACVHCGQCVALCPHGAIRHPDYPEGSLRAVRRRLLPSYEGLLELLRSRRSRRAFEDGPVEPGLIRRVIEAARYAPSAHNEQSTEFIVVSRRATLDRIAALTVAFLERTVRNLRHPVKRAAARLLMGREVLAAAGAVDEFAWLASEWKRGRDVILHGAPCLILFASDRAARFAAVNASLAVMNASLASETLGLGCFYTGYVAAACARDRSIARLLSLPGTHRIYGALALGHPRVVFDRWMEREPPRISWQ